MPGSSGVRSDLLMRAGLHAPRDRRRRHGRCRGRNRGPPSTGAGAPARRAASRVVPLGKRIMDRPIMPFSTRVKRSFISGVGSPTITVRVMSVVPSMYCAPESMRKISFEAELAVRLLCRMIMRDRGMGAGGGDRLEGQVLQFARLFAEGAELRRDVEFGEAALGRFRLQPAEEAADGHAIALLGVARAFLLHLVLARLGQRHGIGARGNHRFGPRQHIADALRRPGGVDQHACLLAQRLQRASISSAYA